ncbi:MAG: phosphatase PAP2 family protein [Candidatus Aminicenantales bacterium]
MRFLLHSHRKLVASLLVLALAALGGPCLLNASESQPFDYRIGKKFLIHAGSDMADLVGSVGDWGKTDIYRLAAVVGSGVFVFALDQEIWEWSEAQKTASSEDWARYGSGIGDGVTLGIFIGSTYLAGELFDKKGLRKTALLSLESWTAAGALVLGLKAVTGRARPYTEEGARSFHPFSFKSAYHAFPSGHTASAFAVATVVAEMSREPVVDFLAYTLSTVVALSRVHRESHWASDVFIGAVLGYVVAQKIVRLHEEDRKKSLRLGVSLSKRSQGITLSLAF